MKSKFQTGSSCYKCRICGKLTRDTGRGEASNGDCAYCCETGGWECSMSDAGHPDPSGLFDNVTTIAEAQVIFEAEKKKYNLNVDL